jgi:hypothetical protein
MTRRLLLSIAAVLSVGFLSACSMFTDPAVRLANCVEEGVKKSLNAATSIEVNCDLKLSGNYVVVLHPAGAKSDEELTAGGVPAAAIAAVRALRIGENASIYVVATDKQTPDSRTTYQNNFVSFDHVMAVTKSLPSVTVSIGGPAGARVIQAVR